MSQAGQDSPTPFVEVRAARLGYGDRVVVEQADLVVQEGEFWAIVGPNGAGKTTVLRSILGVLEPMAGVVNCSVRLGYSPQRSVLDPVFPLTSRQVVEMGLIGKHPTSPCPEEPRPDAWQIPGPSGLVLRGLERAGELFDEFCSAVLAWRPPLARAEVVERSRSALEACGMLHHEDRLFRDLSGGQKQRVLVARALVSDPDVLVLDEPTNDLDLRGEHEVMEVIRSLNEAGRTVIMVSHILHVVSRYAKRLALLHGGRLISGDLAELLTSERLEELYELPVHVGEFAGRLTVATADEAPSA